MPLAAVRLADLPGLIRSRAAKRVAAAVKAVQVTTAVVGPAILQEVISGLRPMPVDRGTYRRSWRVSNTPDGAMILNSSGHAGVIERGRRPGSRMPPPAVLGEWARRKGLLKGTPKGSMEAAQRAIGFVLARAIARKGLPARNVLGTALPRILAAVRAEVTKALKAVE